MTLRACPRPGSLPLLEGPSQPQRHSFLRDSKVWGPLFFRRLPLDHLGVSNRRRECPSGTVALASWPPRRASVSPQARCYAHPRGCGKPCSTAPSAWQCRGAVRSPALEGGRSAVSLLLRDLGPRSPFWASVAVLQKEDYEFSVDSAA